MSSFGVMFGSTSLGFDNLIVGFETIFKHFLGKGE